MTRCRRTSPPRLATLALLLLLVCFSVFHRGAAAARPLPASLVHHEDSVNDAADGLALQDGAAGNGGDELSVSEVMEAEQEADACEKGDVEECMQRRLLRDAHLDYIYTQHDGKALMRPDGEMKVMAEIQEWVSDQLMEVRLQ